MRISFQHPQEIEEFDHIQAARTALHFRHERLWPPELVGNVLLQPAALLAQVGEQRRNPLVARVVDGVGHAKHSRYTYAIFFICIRHNWENHMFQLVWLSSAAVTAFAIVIDMRRLRANRVGLPAAGWAFASACVGPAAGVLYLIQRRKTRRYLIDAAWALAGNASQPVYVRRARLNALARSGVLGEPILQACLAALEQESVASGHVASEQEMDHSM